MKARTRKYIKSKKYHKQVFRDSMFPHSGKFYVENGELYVEILDLELDVLTLKYTGDDMFDIDTKDYTYLSVDGNLLWKIQELGKVAEKIFSDPKIFDQEEYTVNEDMLVEESFIHFADNENEFMMMMNANNKC
jgi:hypothetical protein